jgi:hypothetical protein
MCCKPTAIKIFIVVCSVLTILGGLTFLGLTFNMIVTTNWTMKSTLNSTITASSPNALAQFSLYIAGIAFGLAVLVILFGMFGVCTLKFTSKCYTISYAVSGSLVTLLMLITAIGFTTPIAFSDNKLTKFCNGEIQLPFAND